MTRPDLGQRPVLVHGHESHRVLSPAGQGIGTTAEPALDPIGLLVAATLATDEDDISGWPIVWSEGPTTGVRSGQRLGVEGLSMQTNWVVQLMDFLGGSARAGSKERPQRSSTTARHLGALTDRTTRPWSRGRAHRRMFSAIGSSSGIRVDPPTEAPE
jgi:hypothetical protein